MGKTEDVIMDYLSQPDIIADLFNGYVFRGEQVIRPDMLKVVDNRGRLLLEDSKGKNQRSTFEVIKRERDIVREVTIKDKRLRLMICGVEQQTNVDYSMPLRVLSYDTLEYLKQAKQIEREHRQKKDIVGKEYLSMFAKEDKLIPTVTIVFYTGEEKWDAAYNLDGLFEEVEGLDDLLSYMVRAPLNLLHIYDVKNTERYHSSLRKMFDLLSFAGDKEKLGEYMDRHEAEYASLDSVSGRMIALLLGLELPAKVEDDEKEAGYNMCEAVRQMRESSRAEGRAEGEEHGKREVVLNMLSKNLSLEQIADFTGVALETVREIADNR